MNAPKNIDTLLSTDPIVSIDIELKKTLQPNEVFEIDYPALRNMLSDVNSPEDNSELSIVFTDGVVGMKDIGGLYDPEDREAIIIVNRKKQHTQKRLKHELAHYADFENKPVNKADVVRSIGITAGELTMKVAVWPTLAAVAVNTADRFIGLPFPEGVNETITNVADTTSTIGLPVLIGATILKYGIYFPSPREVLARKEARIESAAVVKYRFPITTEA